MHDINNDTSKPSAATNGRHTSSSAPPVKPDAKKPPTVKLVAPPLPPPRVRMTPKDPKPSPGSKSLELPSPPPEPAAQVPPRPFPLPEECDAAGLPKSVQQGFVEVVGPCIRQLVLGESDALTKAAGHTVACMSMLEIIAVEQATTALLTAGTDPQQCERLLLRIDRMVKGKMRTAEFLQRTREHESRERLHRAANEEDQYDD